MKRKLKKRGYILFFLAFVISMGFSTLSSSAGNKTTPNNENKVASNITIIRGLIENIPDDTIVVRGKRYTITGVPLVRSSGEPATKDQLKRGKKVEIFFDNKNMTSILIYQDMVE